MDRLLELLHERSYAKRRVTLASGRESDFFIDCKQTVLLAEGHALVGVAMFDALQKLPRRAQAVAGVELGGCPLASAVALISFQRGHPLDAIYVRKAAKDHGSQRRLEGDSRVADGTPIAILEDVVTTGGSTIACAEQLRARNLDVVGVIAIVDREEGGRERLDAASLPLVALYTKRSFGAS